MSQEARVEEFLDELMHYGVLGMRWGKRKSSDSSGDSSASAPRKPKIRTADIKEARKRQDVRVREFEEAAADYYTSRSAKGEAFAERTMRNKEWELFNNPDVAVANRMTAGEKWTTAFFVGAPVVVAALAGSGKL